CCRLALSVILIVFGGGCSNAAVGKITGRVTLDGQPLADAEVVFCPTDNPKSGGNSARTRSDGSFEAYAQPRSGRPMHPGNYLVLVTKLVQKNGAVPSAEDTSMLLASGSLHNSLPTKYGEADQSPFKIELKQGENVLSPFELSSKPTR